MGRVMGPGRMSDSLVLPSTPVAIAEGRSFKTADGTGVVWVVRILGWPSFTIACCRSRLNVDPLSSDT